MCAAYVGCNVRWGNLEYLSFVTKYWINCLYSLLHQLICIVNIIKSDVKVLHMNVNVLWYHLGWNLK